MSAIGRFTERCYRILPDGSWAMSAAGNADDWDYAKGGLHSAVAGKLEGSFTSGMYVIDQNHLLIETVSGLKFVLIGEPFDDGHFLEIRNVAR